jgi:hypothetical protein
MRGSPGVLGSGEDRTTHDAVGAGTEPLRARTGRLHGNFRLSPEVR